MNGVTLTRPQIAALYALRDAAGLFLVEMPPELTLTVLVSAPTAGRKWSIDLEGRTERSIDA